MNRFQIFTIGALLTCIAIHVLTALDVLSPYALILCNTLILVGLSVIGTREHKRTGGAFDTAVAAETMVAFGVLTLIFGLVVALYPIMMPGNTPIVFNAESLTAISMPFLQGLATAALAPVLAVVVRSLGSDHGDIGDPAEQLTLLGQAAQTLTQQLEQAGQNVHTLGDVVQHFVTSLQPVAPELEQHMKQIAAAASQFAPSLTAGLNAVVIAFEKDMTELMNQLSQGLAQLEVAGGQNRSAFEQLALSSQATTASMNEANDAIRKLRRGADEAAQLLEALAAMTVSVERFVAMRNVRS